jgi:curved DNA-binding protein CbpA
MSPQHRDYYSLLGVERGASRSDLERAYRRAARATHPDVHPDDSSAAERFAAVTVAYETLRDPARRASYDRANPAIRPGVPVRFVVRRTQPPPMAAPVHLGRQRPHPEPLNPRRAARVPVYATDDLFHLVSAFLDRWFAG